MSSIKRVLVIDDDHSLCTLLSRFLTKNGFVTETALSASTGIEKFKDNKFDLVLCDFRLDDKDGREVLKSIKVLDPQAVVIMITGYSDLKTAVDVIKEGAYDYISKPLIPDEILNVINKALQERKGSSAPAQPQTIAATQSGNDSSPKVGNGDKRHHTAVDDIVIGNAASTKELYKQIEL